jgi:hypothetical protein
MMANVVTKFRPLRDPDEVPLERMDRDPRYVAAIEARDAIARRLELAEHRAKVAKARLGGQRSTTSVGDQAKALVAGGTVAASSAHDELAAALEEQRILRLAFFAESEKLDLLKGELSFEVCSKFEPMHTAAMVAALEAAGALFSALEVARVARGKIQGSGYTLLDGAMPYHAFAHAAAVGDPARSDSPAGLFRAWLAGKGLR